MGVLIEGKGSFLYAAQARLLDVEKHEVAWAERSVQPNPALAFVLGRYVEADRANLNRQFWKLGDLKDAQYTIKHAPLNMAHRAKQVVGHYMDSELVYPTGDSAATSNDPPYIEALACFYKHYFPDEYKVIETAHASGNLFFSMECVSKTITCSGELGCNEEYAYAGPSSDTYCAHLNEGKSIKQLNQPHFLGGALIFPPEKPGWAGAEVRDLSSLLRENYEVAESIEAQLEEESMDLTPAQWQYMMGKLVEQSRQFTTQDRQKMAKKGHAMPDGSYPIGNQQDFLDAIQAFGRAKNPPAVKQHIIRRAKAMGMTKLLPEGWMA